MQNDVRELVDIMKMGEDESDFALQPLIQYILDREIEYEQQLKSLSAELEETKRRYERANQTANYIDPNVGREEKVNMY